MASENESSLKLWTTHVGVPPLDSQAPQLTRGNASYCGFQAYLGCTPTSLAIQARGVRKSFGDQVVLDGIDLDVIEGTVFALLGPNGSGKTTTIRILSTLLAADAGRDTSSRSRRRPGARLGASRDQIGRAHV